MRLWWWSDAWNTNCVSLAIDNCAPAVPCDDTTVMEFDDGNGTLQDGTPFTMPNPTGENIATYEENGYRISLEQTSPSESCTSMSDYYGEPGSAAEVMHIHWDGVLSGCVVSVSITRVDGDPFILSEVGLTTHVAFGPGTLTGDEDAYIRDTNGVEFDFPPNEWGSPIVLSSLPFSSPTTQYTIQIRTPGSVLGLGFAFLTFIP